jgi:hypothetical protein
LLRTHSGVILRLTPVKQISTRFILVLVLAACGPIAAVASEASQTPPASLQGASHPHWAFQQTERPPIPATRSSGWIRTPIDAFILARLEKENLVPSPEADRRTLMRRLSFDLLGLPPRIEDVEAFVADERPEAYELLVNHLLASPHFGERWGRHWLDLARYADSDGYEKDTVRPYAFLYRDWVIDAINRDLPFDQFSTEQLAGDLLPNAGEAQKIATGFHRNTLTNKEGGVDQEEFRCKATVDRVSTTATVWLGLTLGCAECHNHKYDPITQREFYQLFAFFNNASEKDLPAPQPAELAKYKLEKAQSEEKDSQLKAALSAYLHEKIATNQAAWEQTVKLPHERWTVLIPARALSSEGTTLKTQSDHSILATGKNPASDTYRIEFDGELRGVTGFRLEILDAPTPGAGPGRSKNGNFVLNEFTVRLEVGGQLISTTPHPKEREQAVAAANSSPNDQSAPTRTSTHLLKRPPHPFPLPLRGGEGTGEGDGVSNSSRDSSNPEDHKPIRIPLHRASADHAPKDWPVAGAIDGDSKTGWAIDPQFDRSHVAVFETKEDLTMPPGGKLVVELHQSYGSQHTIGRFRLSATSSSRPLEANLIPDSVVSILEQPAAQRDERSKTELTRYYREAVDPGARRFDKQIADHAKTAPKFPETKAQTLVENEKPRATHIHIRGDFLRKGEEVEPAMPVVLHAFRPRNKAGQASSLSSPAAGDARENTKPSTTPTEAGKMLALPDRLDLAEWLFDPANPLTARVTVNHVWYRFFGRGLVATLDDFGTRGEKPSHPELLDWLATEFPRLGWSRKALIKLIVVSSTYRQGSIPRRELTERDPNDILLARQNRIRLEAETVRDSFLAIGGLLQATLGGPGIRPPLPADIAALGYANSVKWKESEGDDRYRRGLYILFQRTVPYPMLMTFDAPDSNTVCTRRERSNTPLQALTLLNDPVFFECAQALGRRMTGERADNAVERLQRTFERCLSRPPTTEETRRLHRLYQDYVHLVEQSPAVAAKLIGGTGADPRQSTETAALIGVARTILNLDEFVTRE